MCKRSLCEWNLLWFTRWVLLCVSRRMDRATTAQQVSIREFSIAVNVPLVKVVERMSVRNIRVSTAQVLNAKSIGFHVVHRMGDAVDSGSGRRGRSLDMTSHVFVPLASFKFTAHSGVAGGGGAMGAVAPLRFWCVHFFFRRRKKGKRKEKKENVSLKLSLGKEWKKKKNRELVYAST